MLKPASPSLHVPLAFCALFALGACLDNSIPLTGPKGGKGQDTIVRGPDVILPVEPDGGNGGPGKAFERLPIRERFDSSLQALRRLKARSKDSYSYKTRSFSWIGYEDSTRQIWSYGKAVSREVWYYWRSQDERGMFENQGHFRETAGSIDTHSEGASALSLDSLYEICRAHLPTDTCGQNWFSLDSNRILRRCGSYPGLCMDDCPPQVDLERVEWELPVQILPDTVPACIMIAPTPDQIRRMPAGE